MSSRVNNGETKGSAAAIFGKATGRRLSYATVTQTVSGARGPSTVATPTQPSQLAQNSRLAPYPTYSSSRQSNVLQRRAAANSASVYSSRSSNVDLYVPNHETSRRNADSYRPSFEPTGRDNQYPSNISERSYYGDGRNNEQGRRLPKSVFQPGTHAAPLTVIIHIGQ